MSQDEQDEDDGDQYERQADYRCDQPGPAGVGAGGSGGVATAVAPVARAGAAPTAAADVGSVVRAADPLGVSAAAGKGSPTTASITSVTS
jgi:hypothetical protein